MYNRYIPADSSYTAVTPEIPTADRRSGRTAEPRTTAQTPSLKALFSQKSILSNMLDKEKGSFGALLKSFKLERFDSGDLLVLLIVLLLLSEGDDWDPVIALGIFLFLEIVEK